MHETFQAVLPSIVISLIGLFGTFFLVKPLYNFSMFPHDLKQFTLPVAAFRELGFTLLITIIDGFIDLSFKLKRGDTNLGKMKKDFEEHMEKSREESFEKIKLVLPTKGEEGVRKRN
jgi:hypothetical protein